MKVIVFKKQLKFLVIIIGLLITKNSFSQDFTAGRNGYFYTGIAVRIATLKSGTSLKTLMGLKFGYNRKLAEGIYAGPQVDAMFIRSPSNKGARISLYAGPSAELELMQVYHLKSLSSMSKLSNRLSWIFPLNPASNDYSYLDCITLSTSYSNNHVGLSKTSVDLNLNFQRYDTGLYHGFNRLISVGTGSVTSF